MPFLEYCICVCLIDLANWVHILGTQLGFDGAGLELPKNMLSGHVPGSANLCYLRLIDTETNCFLSKEEMQKCKIDVVTVFSV